MKKRWQLKEPGDPQTVQQLMAALNVERPIANLLAQRGITTYEEAKHFFRPELAHLHDPFLMQDMELAVARLEQALANGERILVYGDYDVDGTTSVSMVYSFLSTLHDKVGYYIPDRYTEGYGISNQGIDYAKAEGYSLVIALDCGIKAIDKMEHANLMGVDFIICDHHRPGPALPKAVAVLDPKREDCTYPYKELSGCGIGFKLIQAYASRNNIALDELVPYLDLVAISIACDIVPLTGENRTLCHFGLQQLNTNPREGIRCMLELTQLDRDLSVSDLVFVIGPRINAAGRMQHAHDAVEVLIAKDMPTAKKASKVIHDFNTARKDIDERTTQEALDMIEENKALQKRKSTVLFKPDWHKGVIGIVASRLIDEYYRPTILLTENNGKATGSARSVKGFDVYDAIDACSDLLEQFGGHKYAAGLTLPTDNIPAFQQRFEEVVSSTIEPEMLIPQLNIDDKLDLHEITPKLYRVLQQFAPFGPYNMRPLFASKEVMNAGWTKAVGSDSSHLKLHVCQNGYEQIKMSGIAFGMGHLSEQLVPEGTLFDVAYAIDENEWNGNVSLQLKVRDIRY